jgi:hypothetical protein
MAFDYKTKSNFAVVDRCIQRIPRKGGRYSGQLSWRSSNGNFSFEGNRIISYSTPIAHVHREQNLLLLTNEWHSATTCTRHLGAIYKAARKHGMDTLTVPMFDLGHADAHLVNIAALRNVYEVRREYMNSLRANMDWRTNLHRVAWTRTAWDNLQLYVRRFKQAHSMPDLSRHIEKAREKHEARVERYHSPKEQAKREFRDAKNNLKVLVGKEVFE